MKKKSYKEFSKTSRFSKLLLALCELILGVVLLINPLKFTTIIISVGGVLLLAAGLVHILHYFRLSPEEAAQGQSLTLGLLGVMLGLFCIIKREWFIVTFPLLTVLYGVITLLTGVSKIQWAVDLVRSHAKKWFWAAISAAVTLICSAVILGNPFASTAILWVFIGVTLIVEAVFDVIVVIFVKGDTIRSQADTAKEDIVQDITVENDTVQNDAVQDNIVETDTASAIESQDKEEKR